MLEWVVAKYKQRRLETGFKIGWAEGYAQVWAEARERDREHNRATRAWYERQQAALRAGLPFDEPPPFDDSEFHADAG